MKTPNTTSVAITITPATGAATVTAGYSPAGVTSGGIGGVTDGVGGEEEVELVATGDNEKGRRM